MRLTRMVYETNAPERGRQSRVVLAPRRWREVPEEANASLGMTVTKSPIAGESAE
jgi:hypothetical protein